MARFSPSFAVAIEVAIELEVNSKAPIQMIPVFIASPRGLAGGSLSVQLSKSEGLGNSFTVPEKAFLAVFTHTHQPAIRSAPHGIDYSASRTHPDLAR